MEDEYELFLDEVYGAIDERNIDSIKVLIGKGVLDINGLPYDEGCFLRYAAGNDYDGEMIETVKFLIEHGANINAQSKISLKTPLHAIIIGVYEHCYDVAPYYYNNFPRLKQPSIKMLSFFLSYNPDINIKDAAEKTPLDLSVSYGLKVPSQILIEAGGVLGFYSELPEWLN